MASFSSNKAAITAGAVIEPELLTALYDVLDGTRTRDSDSDTGGLIIKKKGGGVKVGQDNINRGTTGAYSTEEGFNCLASGPYSHAEGNSSTASGEDAHAEGESTASNTDTHAEGRSTASGLFAHSEGQDTTASGQASHSEGRDSQATGSYSHAQNLNTIAAGPSQTVMGKYNTPDTSNALIIGNGTGAVTTGNAFTVGFDGNVKADGTFASPAADYAEMFEHLDGNPDKEDRVGLFVTLEGDKIKPAGKDDYILGIISATPSVIGNNPMAWQGKYLTDEFGRVKTQEVVITEEIERSVQTESGIVIEKETVTRTEIQKVINPNYDPKAEYIPREKRPEWDAVGLIGKLLVKDNGLCQVNGYCMPENGIAIPSGEGFRVIKRVSGNIIQIIIK
jgi:hypothetical protein